MRLLVWLLLAILVYWALRNRSKGVKENLRKAWDDKFNNAQAGGATQPGRKASAQIENMVACEFCQIYLPASEAIDFTTSSSVHYFCCEEHAKKSLQQSAE